jgi:hypothetical protein
VVLGLLIGCGGEPEDPTAQVREAVSSLAENARAGEWSDFCAGTTDPEACGQNVVAAQAMGVSLEDFAPTSDVLDGARIKVEDDRATVDATAGENALYVRRDGRWLYVWGP